MKRKPTPEQQEQAKHRREEFKKLVKQIANMPDAERIALSNRLGSIVTVDGHPLSMCNTILASMQHPGLTLVGGFQQWRKVGRMVRKGEHGMMIWVPSTKRTTDDATVSDDDIHFFTGTVFDVSQTEDIAV